MIMILWCWCSGAQLRKLLETKEKFGGFYHDFIVCADSPKANGSTQNLKTSIIHDTSLHTEFLLQVQKQQEDLAIILASNKQQHKEKHKKKKI
jgi:hypothetical protein